MQTGNNAHGIDALTVFKVIAMMQAECDRLAVDAMEDQQKAASDGDRTADLYFQQQLIGARTMVAAMSAKLKAGMSGAVRLSVGASASQG